MGWELKLLDSRTTVRRKILSAFVYELKKRNSTAKIRLVLDRGVKDIITNAVCAAPEYASLVTGRLKGEFGIPNAATKVQSLLMQWISEIHIQIFPWRVVGHRIVGGFTVNAIKGDFTKVTSLPEAHQITEKGEFLPWLKWLLLDGDQIIINDYFYARASKFERFSRTNRGIMISRESGFVHSGWTTGLRSGGWRVPPAYSGTVQNNWITRAILGKGRAAGVRPQIRQLFKHVVRNI